MRRRILSLFILSVFIYASCYEPSEGCTDAFSSNYDVGADLLCEEACCTYPDLIIRFSHEYDGTFFDRDSAYTDDFGNVYRLNQFEFFVSNVSILDDTAMGFGARDNISLITNSAVLTVPNDITHISNLTFSYTVCEIAASLIATQIEFDLGIRYNLDGLNFSGLGSTNALKVFEDSFYLGDRFAFGEIELQRDTFLPEIDLILLDQTTYTGPLNFSYIAEIEKGNDVIVELDIDYKLLMTGVNVKDDVATDIKGKVLDNLANALNLP